jgi:DNA transformation protein
MTTSPEFASYILDQLSESGEVSSRKMFGGVGVYIDGVFCAIVASTDVFYLRVGPANIDDFIQEDMQKFPGGKGKGMPYYEVPEHVVEDKSELSTWASKAKAAALQAKKN